MAFVPHPHIPELDEMDDIPPAPKIDDTDTPIESKRKKGEESKDDKKDEKEGEGDESDEEGDSESFDQEDSDEFVLTVDQRMAKLVNNPKFSDVKFIVGEEKAVYFAHKAILAARSSVFASMFFSQWLESKESEIRIEDLSGESFLTMLQCIYSGRCNLDPSTAIEVLFAAKKYNVTQLIKKCTRYMKKGVGVENACSLFETSPQLMEEEQVVLRFIEDNAEECLASETLLELSKDNLVTIVKSDFLAIKEIDLFNHVIRWGDEQLKQTEGYATMAVDVKVDALKNILADVIPHIRFGTMTVEEFAPVPKSGVLPKEHLLALFPYLAGKSAREAKELQDEDDDRPKFPWNCPACTLFNPESRTKCQACGTAAPKDQELPIDWACKECTFDNRAFRTKCEMCNADRPPQIKAEPKKDPKAEAKKLGFPYSIAPRNPRRGAGSRTRFLIATLDSRVNCEDVRNQIMAAAKRSGLKTATPITIDFHIFNETGAMIPLTFQQMIKYDAILVWTASTGFPPMFGDYLAQYLEEGGGVIVMAVATNSGHYGITGRFDTQYLPLTRGTQVSSAATMQPLKAAQTRHALFRSVKSFDGGSGSYRSAMTLKKGSTLLASWSDGTPLAAERLKPSGGKRCGLCMVLNFYPTSSAVQDGYWRHETDGGLLMLNALMHCAAHGFLSTSRKAQLASKAETPVAAAGLFKVKRAFAAAAVGDDDDAGLFD